MDPTTVFCPNEHWHARGQTGPLNLEQFVARKHWLRSGISPRHFRANCVKKSVPLRGLRVFMYPNFDLLQTARN